MEFYAPWCPYCKRLEPIWNELPSKLEEAGSKTRGEDERGHVHGVRGAYAVTGFPTPMLFENGRPVGAKTGLVDRRWRCGTPGCRMRETRRSYAEKKLDKVLSGAQPSTCGDRWALSQELAGIKDVDSRARALEALQQSSRSWARTL